MSRFFIDAIDPRKKIRADAQAFWVDEEHVRYICEIAFVPFEEMSNCYDFLWTLPPGRDQLDFTSLVRKSLTEDLPLPKRGIS